MKTSDAAGPTHGGFLNSIQGRLMQLLLLMLVPTVLTQANLYQEQSRTRRAEGLQANLEVARAVAGNFESFIEDIRSSGCRV